MKHFSTLKSVNLIRKKIIYTLLYDIHMHVWVKSYCKL
jgi:hypothetical protein